MGRIVRRVGSGCKVRSRLQFRVVQVLVDVTITPYLSRDTTYCYRHCKGISRFPLLLYHPSPRPMPDQIASPFLTLIRLPNALSDSCLKTPSRVLPHGQPHSLISLSFPLDVIMTYDSDLDSDPILPYDIIAY